MDYSIKFWNRIADSYAKKPISDEVSYQQKLTITQQYLHPEMNVLEFGCGTGSTAIVHAPYVKEYQAIDVSPKMIEIAQRKQTAATIDNLTFINAAIEELPVADESLDAVLGMSILHLLNDRDEAIGEVYRMLKPGGVFISSTACLADTMPYIRYIAPVGRFLRLIPKVGVFSRQELQAGLVKSGFRIEKILVAEKNKTVCFLVAIK
ncbi:MAG: methyltransferase domain-containing protein [Motiliproteus sp.]